MPRALHKFRFFRAQYSTADVRETWLHPKTNDSGQVVSYGTRHRFDSSVTSNVRGAFAPSVELTLTRNDGLAYRDRAYDYYKAPRYWTH